jgi:hypothetical protein
VLQLRRKTNAKVFVILKRRSTEGGELKHIHHAEDRPLMHGHSGFEHATCRFNEGTCSYDCLVIKVRI